MPGPEKSTSLRRQNVRRAVRILVLFVSVSVMVNALVGERGLLQLWRARADYRQLDASIQTLKAENAVLLERARQLREDPEAIEQLARQELGLIHRGEVVVIVKNSRALRPAP